MGLAPLTKMSNVLKFTDSEAQERAQHPIINLDDENEDDEDDKIIFKPKEPMV